MTIKCNVVLWIRPWNRMQTLLEKLVKFTSSLELTICQQQINFLVVTNLPWQCKMLVGDLDTGYIEAFFTIISTVYKKIFQNKKFFQCHNDLHGIINVTLHIKSLISLFPHEQINTLRI